MQYVNGMVWSRVVLTRNIDCHVRDCSNAEVRVHYHAPGSANHAATLAMIPLHSRPRRSMIGFMAIPALPVLNRKRGNPNWGRPIPRAPALATAFELQVKQLQLTAEMYTSSRELRIWCDRNRNRVYIPEWLLEKWDITVDAIFSGTA